MVRRTLTALVALALLLPWMTTAAATQPCWTDPILDVEELGGADAAGAPDTADLVQVCAAYGDDLLWAAMTTAGGIAGVNARDAGVHAVEVVAGGVTFTANVHDDGDGMYVDLFRGTTAVARDAQTFLDDAFVHVQIPATCLGDPTEVLMVTFVQVAGRAGERFFDEHPAWPGSITLPQGTGPATDPDPFPDDQGALPPPDLPDEPTEPEPIAPGDTRVSRIGSPTADPVIAAVEISRAQFRAAPTVLLGRGSVFADSLASAVLQDATTPLLLSDEVDLEPLVASELDRLGRRDVILLGGPEALSTEVEERLRARGFTTSRLAGATRIETVLSIARSAATQPDAVVIVRAFGDDGDPTRAYADALSVGPLAASQRLPILLTPTDALAEPVADYLRETGVRRAYVIGGTAAIGDAVVDDLMTMGVATARLEGPDRASTAVAIAEELGAGWDDAVVTDGTSPTSWGSGLAATSLAVARQAAILLSSPSEIPPATEEALMQRGPEHVLCTPQLLHGCDLIATALGSQVQPLDPTAAPPLAPLSDPPSPSCWEDPAPTWGTRASCWHPTASRWEPSSPDCPAARRPPGCAADACRPSSGPSAPTESVAPTRRMSSSPARATTWSTAVVAMTSSAGETAMTT